MQINNCFLRFETAILTDIPKIRYGISVRYAASEHVIFTLIISYSRISVNETRVLGGELWLVLRKILMDYVCIIGYYLHQGIKTPMASVIDVVLRKNL